MWRWLAAFVVILLGVAWFLRGEDLFAGGDDVQPAGRASAGGPVVVDLSSAQGRPQPAQVPSGNEGSRDPSTPRRSEDDGPVAQAAAKAGRDVPPAGTDQRGALETVLAEARRRAERGDVRGAEAVVRDALAKVPSAFDKARCAIQLAPLTSDLVERRRLLSFALAQGAVRGVEYDEVGRMFRELNRQPSSIVPMIEMAQYTVRPNDNLWTLCTRTFPEQFGSSPEVGLLQLLNGMSSDRLHVGQALLVPRAKLRIEIDRREHGLVAYLGDVVLAAYRVGLGKENRTPQGEFVIEVKQKEPTWFHAGRAIPFGDPQNILGTRWMGFENSPGATGYGIHGTANPETVGFDESMGCVRMRNEEVEELFELVARGTIVTIP